MKTIQEKVMEMTQNEPLQESDTNVNNTKQKASNPFKDVFKEMNNSDTTNSVLNMLGGLNNEAFSSEDEQVKSIGKLYEVLTKLSNTKDGEKGNIESNPELYKLFEELLEFL